MVEIDMGGAGQDRTFWEDVFGGIQWLFKF
jgi:hypothetical protein